MYTTPELTMLALKLKGSPDSYIADITPEKLDGSLTDLPANLQFEQWERISVEYKDCKIKKMKLLQKDMPSDAFKEKFHSTIPKIVSHIERVSAQHRAVLQLKQRLSEGHITCQMDFLENWSIQYSWGNPSSILCMW